MVFQFGIVAPVGLRRVVEIFDEDRIVPGPEADVVLVAIIPERTAPARIGGGAESAVSGALEVKFTIGLRADDKSRPEFRAH
jgi:hypothetical protein